MRGKREQPSKFQQGCRGVFGPPRALLPGQQEPSLKTSGDGPRPQLGFRLFSRRY